MIYSRELTVEKKISTKKKFAVLKKSPQQTVIFYAKEHVSYSGVESNIHATAHYNNAQSESLPTVVGIHIIKITLNGNEPQHIRIYQRIDYRCKL